MVGKRNKLSEIIRLVARFPLDVATDARFLVGGNGLAGENGVERGAEVFAGDRDVAAGAAIIHLAAINQSLVFVEEVNIRRARRVIRLGGRLSFIVQVGKDIPS